MSYNYSSIKISIENNHFSHNLKDDYGCFVLWEPARPYLDWIRELLSSKFEILLETEIEWSTANFHDNASRFYKRPLYDDIPKEDRFSEKAYQIGDNVFILFVIKDHKPNYSYIRTTSDILEIGNSNIYNLKNQIRTTIFDEIGTLYPIHSTNSIHEFFFQMPLLLGPELFTELLKGTKPAIKRISKDLEGADGWSSWDRAFEVLNLTSNYLSLDNYKGLPIEYGNKSISLLTDNYQQVASALNVIQLSTDGYKGFIQVNNKLVPIDIRFIGDNYYNTSWQKDMLNYKVNRKGVYVLRDDMFFFSLLFRKAYKHPIENEDIEILDDLAKKLGFAWYEKESILNDEIIGRRLGGYFRAHNYHYEDPIDKNIFKNRQIIRQLPSKNSIVTRESRKTRVKRKLKNILPKGIFQLLKKLTP